MSPLDLYEDVVVLEDGEGSYYALPLSVLERYRAGDEQKSAIVKALDESVNGYSMYQHYIASNVAGQQLSDLRRQAANGRMLKEAGEASEEGAEAAEAMSRARRVYSGILAKLRIAREQAVVPAAQPVLVESRIEE